MALKAQHENTQRLHEEAPHHAERVGFGQDRHVTAAADDRDDLQDHDQIDHAIGGSEALMRLAEPWQQHAVFGNAIQDAVGADDRSIRGAGQNQSTHDHYKNMKAETQHVRPAEVHRKAADEIVEVLGADIVGDDHAGEHRYHAGANHCIPAGDIRRDPEVLEFRGSDFAVNLGQRFESAHRQQ